MFADLGPQLVRFAAGKPPYIPPRRAEAGPEILVGLGALSEEQAGAFGSPARAAYEKVAIRSLAEELGRTLYFGVHHTEICAEGVVEALLRLSGYPSVEVGPQYGGDLPAWLAATVAQGVVRQDRLLADVTPPADDPLLSRLPSSFSVGRALVSVRVLQAGGSGGIAAACLGSPSGVLSGTQGGQAPSPSPPGLARSPPPPGARGQRLYQLWDSAPSDPRCWDGLLSGL